MGRFRSLMREGRPAPWREACSGQARKRENQLPAFRPGRTCSCSCRSLPTDSCGSTVKGLTGTGSKSFTQDTAGVPGPVEAEDQFGASVELTDSNKDGRAELVADAFAENEGGGSVLALQIRYERYHRDRFDVLRRRLAIRRACPDGSAAWTSFTACLETGDRLWSAPWRTR
ncbi:hypothetical protein OG705_18810 [Streptomyces sp. NBC_00838]|uniref:hypothetical protein n=1 Tax=Streptomyces sp. NBC_00838 TaxID=2903680 RepID=UPI0038672109|nr:hypothetical protein OG705_18810 [Streptomyces sp. NBC_00838]